MGDNIIDIVCDRISFDKDKLQSAELQRIEVDSFNLSEFWPQFGKSVQALSNEVTKIGFICGKRPYPTPEEMSCLIQDMMQYYTVMRDLYLVLPEEVGLVVFKAVTSAVTDIMAALLEIVYSLKDLTEKGAKGRLSLTGTFWDACNAVESLPRNNLTAAIQAVYAEAELAKDAQDELITTLDEDRELVNEVVDANNDDIWTNSERDFANRSLGLVKVTHLCVKRIHKVMSSHGSCDNLQSNTQLDQVTACVREISPALDDFVSELYHPIDFSTAVNNASKLVSVLHKLLSSVRGTHLAVGLDKDTVNKLLQFISHNYNKLDPSSLNPIQEFNKLSVNC